MEKPELPVAEGHIYRCPVEGCHCEISIERPPQNIVLYQGLRPFFH